MSATLLIVLGALAIVMVLVLAWGRGPYSQPRRPRSISGRAEREAAMAAQADVEAHDIEEMIEARNALRARIGKPPLGQELADEARRDRPDGAD
jgi:hypothetical protein